MRMTNTKIILKTEQDIDELINTIRKRKRFAQSFVFENKDLRKKFLSSMGIVSEEFEAKGFYVDETKKIHIAESENGYLWISTMGLVSSREHEENKFVYAFQSQYMVMKLLTDYAIKISEDESIWNIDSWSNEEMGFLTHAIFNNLILFLELFGKTYLSLVGYKVKHTHRISKIICDVKKAMNENGHNDTLFHECIIKEFEKIGNYIQTIPGSFVEEYVKYNDNKYDDTVIRFDKDSLKRALDFVNTCMDFIDSFSNKGNYLLRKI